MANKLKLEIELPEGVSLEYLDVGEELVSEKGNIRVKILSIKSADETSSTEKKNTLRDVQSWFAENNLLPDDPVAFKHDVRGEI